MKLIDLMPWRSLSLVLFLLLGVVTHLAGCADAPDQPVLRFSAIPDQDSADLDPKFQAWAEHLSEQLSVEVEYVPVSDYKAAVEMFKNGDIQLAWFGGLTGVQARRAVPGANAIAQGIEDPAFISYFIADASLGIDRSDDFPQAIRGQRYAFGSESSTSGRLMPEYYIRQYTGQSPTDFLGSPPLFSGSHDKTVELVESGRVGVGMVNSKVYDRRVAEGETDPARAVIIWQTPPYPDYNFTAHPKLEAMFGSGFTDKLQRVLIETDDPDLLAAFPRSGLITAENGDYQMILDTAKELGFVR